MNTIERLGLKYKNFTKELGISNQKYDIHERSYYEK